MNYFEVQILDNVCKIQYNSDFKDEDLIMGSQEREVKDLSTYKIHSQILKAGGKLLDFYRPSSNLSMRVIVSTKAKSLLESFRKDNIRYYPCPVLRGKEPINGYWITDKVIFDDQWVDFSRSDFVYINRKLIAKDKDPQKGYEKTIQIISFNSLNHLNEFTENEMWYMDELNPHRIFIKEGCPYSILSIPSTGIFQLIFTEEVKIELQKQKMDKGIEFKPLEIPDEEWYGPNGLRKQFYK
ncbi:hypothetical protein [Algoriphagus hitonicola]|uniref:Uncharacterized protein n=1 Tax=Algoriphagus hitonicola TaxID=435880 RepID=A0A1I2S4F6_9BACT|nr:hypothetical protein [Algoriphagus hitonicola]SFG47764.1 hypothetical protein SAMN04487988_104125 [Algoriphagus hitonicola]